MLLATWFTVYAIGWRPTTTVWEFGKNTTTTTTTTIVLLNIGVCVCVCVARATSSSKVKKSINSTAHDRVREARLQALGQGNSVGGQSNSVKQ